MKAIGDEIAAAGKPVDDDEMVSFILNGLDHDYNPIVSSVQVVQMRLEMLDQRSGTQYQSSANSASRGRGGYNSHGHGSNRGRGTGRRGSGGRCTSPSTNKTGGQSSKPRCQIYSKPNHTALECWYRFEEDYQPPSNSKSGGSSSAAYGVDTNWYVDSGASVHMTGELEKVTLRDKYGGHDQIHTANGSGMSISNIGHSALQTPVQKVLLRNILHVPNAHKSLASVHCLAAENNIYFEFHPNFFLIVQRRWFFIEADVKEVSIL